jgi:hypothetical protein
MSTIDRRLTALEQRHEDAERIRGIRIFQESHDTPEVFYEVQGAFYAGPQGYTSSDLSLLSAMGWQIIKVVYGTPLITEDAQ